jgi:3-mercaptopyruvate sulfurtransferase SseA
MLRIFLQLLFLLLIPSLPALLCALPQLTPPSSSPLLPGEIRPATAKLWKERVLWVDYRARQLYEKRHIPGAVSCPPEEFSQRTAEVLARWSHDKAVVLYGDSEAAGHSLADRLRKELHLETVYVLKGDWRAWNR